MTGKIVDSQPYGKHIPLTCRNHTHLTWHTKNISPIGARSIFYRSFSEPECKCSINDLIPLEETK